MHLSSYAVIVKGNDENATNLREHICCLYLSLGASLLLSGSWMGSRRLFYGGLCECNFIGRA